MTRKINDENKIIEKLLKDKVARVATAQESHYLFFHTYFNQYVEYETANFQREMFSLTEDEKVGLSVIVAFRDSGKSSIITTSYPLWAILGKQKKKHILILSQTQDKARGHLRNIKYELEHNEVLRNDLGPFEEEHGEFGVQALVLSKFGAKISTGSVGQSIRGIRHREHRPDLIIADDIEDTASVKTQEGRDKTWNWFVGEIIPAGSRKTKIVAVGNLLHRDSVLKRIESHIVGGYQKGVYREYPIIDEDKNPLWPGKYPTKQSILDEKERVMDRIAWHREYLLEIVADDDQIVLEEWIQYYDELPSTNPHDIYISVDPAISERQTADCTAIVCAYVYGKDKDARVYILGNIVNKRMSFRETVETIQSLSQSVSTGTRAKIIIEGNSYQEALVQEVKQKGMRVESIKNYSTDKHARLYSAANLLEKKKVYFPRHGSNQLVNQILGFGIEKHDDLMDACAMSLNYILKEINRPKATAWCKGVPRMEDMLHLNTRQQHMIMEKYRNGMYPVNFLDEVK